MPNLVAVGNTRVLSNVNCLIWPTVFVLPARATAEAPAPRQRAPVPDTPPSDTINPRPRHAPIRSRWVASPDRRPLSPRSALVFSGGSGGQVGRRGFGGRAPAPANAANERPRRRWKTNTLIANRVRERVGARSNRDHVVLFCSCGGEVNR